MNQTIIQPEWYAVHVRSRHEFQVHTRLEQKGLESFLPVVERLRTSHKEGVDYHPYLPREDGRLPMSDFGGVHRYNVTGLFHDMWGFPSDNSKVVHGLI